MRLVSYTRTTSCFPGAEITPKTITEQNERIKDYANQHGWKIRGKYSDRKKDVSENTAFERLMQDGMQRKFDAVILDSIFRAGKDLWTAREVLLETLQFAGISFIVVEDDFCGIDKSTEEAERYMDQKYGQLRRENIRYRVIQRGRSGILSWNDLKYGYRMTKDYHLEVNEETAPVVKRMFQMCADGMTPKEIEEIFQKEKIPRPLASRGTNVRIDDPYGWNKQAVRRLLDKTVYIGHWSKVVKGEEIHFTNEPIVDENTFQKVQDYLASIKTNAKPPRPKHRYNMLVCDKDLGYCIRLRKSRLGYEYFVYAAAPKDYEGPGQLLVTDLEKALREKLNEAKEKANFLSERIHMEGDLTRQSINKQMQMVFQKRAFLIAESQKTRMESYRRYNDGEITDEEYQKEEDAAVHMVDQYEKTFSSYFDRVERLSVALSDRNPWIRLYSQWEADLVFDKETLNKYIARVTLHHMTIDKIELKEQDWLDDFPDEWR